MLVGNPVLGFWFISIVTFLVNVLYLCNDRSDICLQLNVIFSDLSVKMLLIRKPSVYTAPLVVDASGFFVKSTFYVNALK